MITASEAGTTQINDVVHRHFCRRRRTLNDAYNAAVGRFKQGSNSNPQVIRAAANQPRVVSRPTPLAALRRMLCSLMDFPDWGRGWVGSATVAARALMRERKFDVVITSGPPHSVHFAGLFATLGHDVDFWVDMRDPWSQAHGMNTPDDWFVPAERFVLQRLERLLFPRAAKVIANTREFASALRIAEPAIDVIWFPNGTDLEQLPPRDRSAVEQGSIAYVGTLYAGRNLSSVCVALGKLLSARPEAAGTLRLNIAGPIESAHRAQLQADIAAAGLASVVSVHGVLPRSKALDVLNRSHLALVLAQDQPLQVPAKLYECIGLGIPTLVIAEPTSAAASEALRIGAWTLDGSDVEGMRSLFEEMLICRIPTTITTGTPVSYEELGTRMNRLLSEGIEQRNPGPVQEAYAPAMSDD